jgi:drug/metabolite transporter (DMT)-like permease
MSRYGRLPTMLGAQMLAIGFAFVAAFLSAVNVSSQHVASTAAPAAVKGWRLAVYLIRNPLWLLGVIAVIGSFIFQAMALYRGRLSVVQSILITELVFTLLIGTLWLHRTVTVNAWLSAVLTAAALAAFLVVSEPQGGHAQATAAAWLPALLTFGGLSGLCALGGRRGSPTRRAAMYAAGSGIVAALLATFLKAAADFFATLGPLEIFLHGATYGLIAAGIIGTIFTQAALHVGPLAVSQAVMVVSNPVVSIVLSVWLYGEHFTGGAPRLAAAALTFAAMVVGVVLLARTAPSLAAATVTHPPRRGPPAEGGGEFWAGR